MADVNHVISLGLGTPADIPHFILVGLSPIAAIDATPDAVIEVRADVGTIQVSEDVGIIEVTL